VPHGLTVHLLKVWVKTIAGHRHSSAARDSAMRHHATRSLKSPRASFAAKRVVNVALQSCFEPGRELDHIGIARVAIADINQMNSNIGADELHVVEPQDQRRLILRYEAARSRRWFSSLVYSDARQRIQVRDAFRSRSDNPLCHLRFGSGCPV
jgi:hypothetical protein